MEYNAKILIAEESSTQIKKSIVEKRTDKKCGHKDVVVHRDNLAIV